MVDVVLETRPVVLCQCVPPCHMPFYVDDVLSPDGCRLPQGHPPPCSADGPDTFTYRETPERVGPRLHMLMEPGTDIWRATCHRCGRSYALGMVTLSAEAAEVAFATEDALERVTEAAAGGAA